MSAPTPDTTTPTPANTKLIIGTVAVAVISLYVALRVYTSGIKHDASMVIMWGFLVWALLLLAGKYAENTLDEIEAAQDAVTGTMISGPIAGLVAAAIAGLYYYWTSRHAAVAPPPSLINMTPLNSIELHKI
jgi:hypothetical protein